MKKIEILNNIINKLKKNKLAINDIMRMISDIINELSFQILFSAMFIISGIYLYQYFSVFNGNQLSQNIEDFSGFGSYLGGLGSIFSVLTFIFLILTYRNDRQKSNKNDEEDKLLKYYDILQSNKKIITCIHESRIYDSTLLFHTADEIVSSVDESTTVSDITYFVVNGEPKSFNSTKECLVKILEACIPMSNQLYSTLYYIYFDTNYLSRKNSTNFILSSFTDIELLCFAINMHRNHSIEKEIIKKITESDEITAVQDK